MLRSADIQAGIVNKRKTKQFVVSDKAFTATTATQSTLFNRLVLHFGFDRINLVSVLASKFPIRFFGHKNDRSISDWFKSTTTADASIKCKEQSEFVCRCTGHTVWD